MLYIIKKILPYSIYPLVLVFGFLIFFLLQQYNINTAISTYSAIAMSLVVIFVLEFILSYRKQWIAKKIDIVNDILYLLIIQMLLPKFLIIVLTFNLITVSPEYTQNNWFNNLPSVYQLIIMLLFADFFRYWLHRLFHENSRLWSFHAIHHSPHKLYSLNVGRFHFVDKSLQYLFDTIPFILLGISQEALAMYFVFYAINGFFQHCNINVKLGVLNYVISGPELHRWHHSKITNESNHNYGNNLIIWDIIFGTWFLPQQQYVKELGLINRKYPNSFFSQLYAPFVSKLDKRNND